MSDEQTTADGGLEIEEQQNAYRVQLPSFEGPLDLLLHLIKKHELDILDIPIGFISKKYVEYIKTMELLSIDLASEYLVMAATLAHIKSRSLLPPDPSQAAEDDLLAEEEDPRAELIRRLLEYQKYKNAAENLSGRAVLGRDVFTRGAPNDETIGPAPLAQLSLFKLVDAFEAVLTRAKRVEDHQIDFERISITERIGQISELLRQRGQQRFEQLFDGDATRADMIVTFLALLEMTKLRMTSLRQDGPLEPIYIELSMTYEEEDEDALSGASASKDQSWVSEFDEEEADDEPLLDEDSADEDEADESLLEEDAADEDEADEPLLDEDPAEEDAADGDAADEPLLEEDAADEHEADEPLLEEDAADEHEADEPLLEEDAADEHEADEPLLEEDAADEDAADGEAAGQRQALEDGAFGKEDEGALLDRDLSDEHEKQPLFGSHEDELLFGSYGDASDVGSTGSHQVAQAMGDLAQEDQTLEETDEEQVAGEANASSEVLLGAMASYVASALDQTGANVAAAPAGPEVHTAAEPTDYDVLEMEDSEQPAASEAHPSVAEEPPVEDAFLEVHSGTGEKELFANPAASAPDQQDDSATADQRVPDSKSAATSDSE